MTSTYQNLRTILGAYLHQDFGLEYGTPDEAILDFAKSERRVTVESALLELLHIKNMNLGERELKELLETDFSCQYNWLYDWPTTKDWLGHMEMLLSNALSERTSHEDRD
jgi:hypothetical protein